MAESSAQGKLVAASTNTPLPESETPCICTKNSVLTRRPDSLSPSLRELQSESISSTNITHGARSLASWKSDFTNFSLSPCHLLITSEEDIARNVAATSVAHACAKKVLPVPGGPYSKIPRHGFNDPVKRAILPRDTQNLQGLKSSISIHYVQNFLALCASNFYNGLTFHRNIKGFLIQGGDPTGTGKGGESIYGGLFEDEIVSHLKHDKRGVVSMANLSKPETNGSQFFITYSKQPQLNGSYTVFGRVIDGMDTLDKMEKGRLVNTLVQMAPEPVGKKYRPLNPITIERVTIHANPIAENDSEEDQKQSGPKEDA
ncbi:cyclophilin [Babesia ovis]|uniref:Cyclophilin n=1 Tax=Babesia ovis TaxID=5869 RepID=A0A9W5TC95_BABOV|nr:cyclophilin [Babesia ovis]